MPKIRTFQYNQITHDFYKVWGCLDNQQLYIDGYICSQIFNLLLKQAKYDGAAIFEKGKMINKPAT